MNRGKIGKGGLLAVSGGLLLVCLVPFCMESRYQIHLAIMSCINIMLALSFSVLFSAGLTTIGAAAFWAIGAYTSTLLMTQLDISFWLALPASGAAAALIAAGVGAVIVRTPGVAFIVQTMVVNIILVEVFGHFEFFGSWGGILDIPGPALGSFEFASKTAYYYLALALLAFLLCALWALYSSRVGRAWRSIRLNPRLAEAAGIDVFRYRLLAFVIGSAVAGIAGSFYAHYFRTVEPNMFSVYKSIYVQIYSIVGGLEYYLLGPVVGAALMTFVPEFLRVGKEIEPILTGAVLIMLVVFLPGGILSLRSRFRTLHQARGRKREQRANAACPEEA